jgi:hypothetical protein
MTSSPDLGFFSQQPPPTFGQAKTALDQVLAVLCELPGGGAGETLTIAGGGIAPSRALVTVETEGGAAADDLDRVLFDTHDSAGRHVLLRPLSGRTVTVRHGRGGEGEIWLQNLTDFAMATSRHWLALVRVGSQWHEWSRSYGSDQLGWQAFMGISPASEALRGLVELATVAETMAGTDALRAVTPAALAGSKSLGAAEGRYSFPGGFTIQWKMLNTSSSADTTWTFATPFAQACVYANAAPVGAAGVGPRAFQLARATLAANAVTFNIVGAGGKRLATTVACLAAGY